jgi:DNA topoisomerase I
MKKLLIVESPNKIKTISKFLDKDFIIMSTVGHIIDLPTNKLGVTINGSIDIDYAVMEGKGKVIADIVKAARNSDAIYLAPDPDREGEIIAWHIGREIEKVFKDKDKIYRIAFNEITKPAIVEAVNNPSHVDMKKVAAQQARRVLDRWVGYEVSPILWRKISKGLSAGRVQSVVLRLVCEREEAIRIFKPEEYWSIEGTFKHKIDAFNAMLTHISKKPAKIKNEKSAKEIEADLKNQQFSITSIQDKDRKKNPLPPFMTSTLQQAAYNKLGMSSKKTMMVAQKLYEGLPISGSQTALITYMRTDSLRLSDTALKQAREFIKENMGKDYLPTKTNTYAKKGKGSTQDAHEAVRPVDAKLTPDYVRKFVSADEARLYELIWQRFMACQMTPALYKQRQVKVDGGKYTFSVTGSTLVFDGFLKVYSVEEDKENSIKIPKSLEANSPVDLTKIDPKQHFTQPPPRFSEATLVKEMEKEGIGRPSTYTSILSTIQARDYVKLDKKRFVPTELGEAVTKLLKNNMQKIMDIKFTALMEEDLDKIASGEVERDAILREFYTEFKKDLETFKGDDEGKHSEPTDIDCPECKKFKLAIRFSKSGEFVGCGNYPTCKFSSNFVREEDGTIKLVKAKEPELLDIKCPNCSKQLRKVMGKFGEFVACSGYPECKYIPQEKAKFPCPKCKGDIVKRKWRGGSFWGCGNYPKCRFAVFGEIEEKPCPKCKLPFMGKKADKTGKETVFCNDLKGCGHKEG